MADLEQRVEAGARKSPKDRILLQIKSLDPTDDEPKKISKIVSWILRRGATEVGVSQDPQRWVRYIDMCACDVLREWAPERIWAVIVESNAKKMRYEISGDYLRAFKKSDEGTSVGPTPTAAAPAHPDQAVQAQQIQANQAYAAGMIQQQQMLNWQAMMMPYMTQYMWQQPAAQHGRFQGRVKSINSEKGFGFIECQQTFVQHNRDVFLHKAQLGDLQVGTYVSFTCEVNKQGMPQARDVKPLAGAELVLMQQSAAMGLGKGGGKGKGGKGKGKGGGKDGDKGGKGGKKAKGNKDRPAKDESTETGAAAPASAESEKGEPEKATAEAAGQPVASAEG